MIRKWLRAWLGIDAGDELCCDQGLEVSRLERRIMDLQKENEALKYQRTQRETKSQRLGVADWERVQAEYAANPENFKEN